MSTDTTPLTLEEQQQAAHQAAMDRAIQGIYTSACVVGQVGQLRPELLPRLMVCATVHSLERLITIYRQKEEQRKQHGEMAWPAEERHRMITRILSDCDDATVAMTEALQSVGKLRAIILTPESKLVS